MNGVIVIFGAAAVLAVVDHFWLRWHKHRHRKRPVKIRVPDPTRRAKLL